MMTRDQIHTAMMGFIADHTWPEDVAITPDKTLLDIGFDSLDVVELEMQVENEWSFEIPEDVFTLDTTVESVLKYVSDKLPVPA